MREWLLAVGPLTASMYFMVYPDQLRGLLAWVTTLLL